MFKIGLLICLTTLAILACVIYRPTFLGGDTRFEPVLSGSMEPAIPVGSIVLIKPVDIANLKSGDVICYRASDTMLVTHRIIEVKESGFVTQGDANEEADIKTVNNRDVVGSVVLTVPFIGYLGSFVRTPIGFLLLLVLPACAVIIIEIRSIIAQKRGRPSLTSKI
jgi:signal peptidase